MFPYVKYQLTHVFQTLFFVIPTSTVFVLSVSTSSASLTTSASVCSPSVAFFFTHQSSSCFCWLTTAKSNNNVLYNCVLPFVLAFVQRNTQFAHFLTVLSCILPSPCLCIPFWNEMTNSWSFKKHTTNKKIFFSIPESNNSSFGKKWPTFWEHLLESTLSRQTFFLALKKSATFLVLFCENQVQIHKCAARQ